MENLKSIIIPTTEFYYSTPGEENPYVRFRKIVETPQIQKEFDIYATVDMYGSRGLTSDEIYSVIISMLAGIDFENPKPLLIFTELPNGKNDNLLKIEELLNSIGINFEVILDSGNGNHVIEELQSNLAVERKIHQTDLFAEDLDNVTSNILNIAGRSMVPNDTEGGMTLCMQK